MKLSLLTILPVITCSLVACGGSDLPAANNAPARQQSVSESDTMNSHTVSGMKKALHDAKAVEGMLQQHHEQQRRDIDRMSQ